MTIEATDCEFQDNPVVLAPAGADTTYESAEDMYGSLGWPIDWESEHDSGQVTHPVWSMDELEGDDDTLMAQLDEDMCDEEREVYVAALGYARGAKEDMQLVEASLAEAVAAYKRRDLAVCVAALEEASSAEREYGDDPATRDLASRLLSQTHAGLTRRQVLRMSSAVSYTTPPVCQGQMVKVGYGCDGVYIYVRTHYCTTRVEVYEHAEFDADECPCDFAGRVPDLGELVAEMTEVAQ